MPKFSYIDTRLGQIHIAEEGSGEVLLLLHQTPRSWDEFRELIPLLSDKFHVIAMDMYGFGQSQKFPSPHTIDDYADGVVALLEALHLHEINLMGHHTGALVAFAYTATYPESVKNLVLTSLGERPFQPFIGSNIYKSLFEPNDFILVDSIKFNIQNTLHNNEPRVSLVDVSVLPDADSHSISVNIVFIILNTQNVQTLNLILKRVR